jgi:RNA polymerase sigma-70 factor (ECF subfamily)
MAMTTAGDRDHSAEPVGDDTPFLEFLSRVRAGDEWAAVELVRRYEPALRMEIRLRLSDPRLRRLLEPADLCQSVLKSFFVRATSGQYDLDSPEKLLALLLTMARNKVAQQARRQQAQRRDRRREVSLDENVPAVASAGPSPSRIAIGRELLETFRGRLTDQERRLADLRAQGFEWVEIARELGGTPQALRKRLSRAVDRVARELGIDEDQDEGEGGHGQE